MPWLLRSKKGYFRFLSEVAGVGYLLHTYYFICWHSAAQQLEPIHREYSYTMQNFMLFSAGETDFKNTIALRKILVGPK